jgi:hypothetical protein
MASYPPWDRRSSRKWCIQQGKCMNSKVVSITGHLDFQSSRKIQDRLIANYLSRFSSGDKSRAKALNRYYARVLDSGAVLLRNGARDFCMECTQK